MKSDLALEDLSSNKNYPFKITDSSIPEIVIKKNQQ
jgi:hypothetical protein